jgi:hypothetical protein
MTKFKNALYRGLIFMPDSPILKGEMTRLKIVDGKIDGIRAAVDGITTHKDFVDVACRCYCSILDNRDLAVELPSNAAMESQIESTKNLLKNKDTTQETITNMLMSIYG